MPFLFAVIIAISFSGKASISFKINKKMSQFLGNFSYALYICSNCWSYFIARIFPEWSYRKAACVYVSLAILCALVCMIVCSLLASLINKNKYKVKQCFLID